MAPRCVQRPPTRLAAQPREMAVRSTPSLGSHRKLLPHSGRSCTRSCALPSEEGISRESFKKQGFIWREGRKGWQMRFLVVDQRTIAFYETAVPSSSPSSIAFLDELTLTNTATPKTGRYAFRILRMEHRHGLADPVVVEWVLAGQSESDSLEWISALIDLGVASTFVPKEAYRQMLWNSSCSSPLYHPMGAGNESRSISPAERRPNRSPPHSPSELHRAARLFEETESAQQSASLLSPQALRSDADAPAPKQSARAARCCDGRLCRGLKWCLLSAAALLLSVMLGFGVGYDYKARQDEGLFNQIELAEAFLFLPIQLQQSISHFSATVALGVNLTSMQQAYTSSALLRWASEEYSSGSCPNGLLVHGPEISRINALIYTALLLYMLLGVALASESLLAAIERITSQVHMRELRVNGGKRKFTVTIWNPTVANLTLMTLGSSAPVVLLSTIEICSSGFYAGTLGPATVVGSAAFNMLVILGVCIAAIPTGAGRMIQDRAVLATTTGFSLFAYIWLVVILEVSTPNVISVWEGTLTFAFFPLMVLVTHRLDVNNSSSSVMRSNKRQKEIVAIARDGTTITMDDVVRVAKEIKQKLGDKLGSNHSALIAEAVLQKSVHSRAYYRVTSGWLEESDTDPRSMALRTMLDAGVVGRTEKNGRARAIVQFEEASIVVRESDRWTEIALKRSGNMSASVSVGYFTRAGTTSNKRGFQVVRGVVRFGPWETARSVRVWLTNDDKPDLGETFSIQLCEPSPEVEIGTVNACTVTIKDDVSAGMLKFAQEAVSVSESVGEVTLTVCRTQGSKGEVSVSWRTSEVSISGYSSAVGGVDFEVCSGELIFGDGVTSKIISIPIIDCNRYEAEETFQVVLTDPKGCSFPPEAEEDMVCTITIVNDEDMADLASRLAVRLNFNRETTSLASSSWKTRFSNAVTFNGDTIYSKIIFFLMAPWKLVLAYLPPTSFLGGWLCFFVSLFLIGVVTALIADLANTVGCTIGFPATGIAISFVAMSTSLPDTFALKQAAEKEPYADSAIGSITASNAVNVFLGLGLPWGAAAVYWSFLGDAHEAEWRERYHNEEWYTDGMAVAFAVPAGDLGFSVLLFSVCAVICVAVLLLRRAFLGFELGGPFIPKLLSCLILVGLWGVYLACSILKINHMLPEAFA
ncbi:hypothetical protein AB1Y20_011903 [Prymnesium parvum]|uniref:PH domain-containing protein n=1 Tax=Prymnesium parvum TaxID=97485 RepID=A0AB34IL98_PRYPA